LTISSFIVDYKKKSTVEQLKANYSIFLQAIENSKLENGDISTWDTSLSEAQIAEKYVVPYLKVVNTFSSDKYKPSPKNLQDNDGYIFWWGANVYALNNGATFVVTNRNYAGMLISVDINGEKAPNIVGKDVFTFSIDKTKNTLLPFGYNFKREQIIDSQYSYNVGGGCHKKGGWGNYYRGSCCAALIMNDGWQIKDGYPW